MYPKEYKRKTAASRPQSDIPIFYGLAAFNPKADHRMQMASALVLKSPQQLLAENDEFIALYWQLAATAPAAKRFLALTKILSLRYANHPAGEPATIVGDGYLILISAKCEERKFSLAARVRIFALLGKKRALELFTITLKAAKEAPEIQPDVFESLVTTENTGYRTLKAVVIAPAQRAA
jgi:hypothetical protein